MKRYRDRHHNLTNFNKNKLMFVRKSLDNKNNERIK